MHIYLLRHAIAVARGTPNYKDSDRPLTEEGKKKLRKAAQGITALVGNIDLILTSPLIRARDTAQITAAVLGAKEKLEMCPELAPGGSIKGVVLALEKYKNFKNILLVGHEPDISSLASSLLGSATPVMQFKKGALCCIELDTIPTKRPGKLLWHIPPKTLRAMG